MMTERMKTSGKSLPSIYICKALGHYTIYIHTYMHIFFDQKTYDILLFSPSSDFMSPRVKLQGLTKVKMQPIFFDCFTSASKDLCLISPLPGRLLLHVPIEFASLPHQVIVYMWLTIKISLITFFKLNQFFITKCPNSDPSFFSFFHSIFNHLG